MLAVLIGLVSMLAIPSFAMGQAAVAEPATSVQTPTPADEATPVEQTPVEQTPVDEGEVAPAPTDPATPVDEAPATDDGSTEAPAPPPTEQSGTAVPTPAPTGEVVPTPEVVTPPESQVAPLPLTPDAPRLGPAVKVPAVLVPVAPATTPTGILPAQVVAAAPPDAPKVVPAPADTAARPATPARAAADLPSYLSVPASLDPRQTMAPATPDPAATAVPSSMDISASVDPEAFGGVQAVAPQGSVSNGASLLEVLAGFVMPGSTGPPASSIVFLILLGTLLLAAYAPRPQMSERLHLLGLMGPRSGHAMAVRRPG